LLAALCWAPLAAGCGLCHTPYDSAGPVIGAGGCPTCGFHDRAGSATAAAGTPTPAFDGESIAVEEETAAAPKPLRKR
jgi:hypothetical protein